jgi:hypothetical protein
MVLTVAQGTYHHAYWKYRISFVIIPTGQRERKILPDAIPVVEESMIPIDKLTTTVPKSNAKYEMIDNR